jgi:hypothetical protein
MLRTRAYPWFVLAIVVIVVGVIVLHGTGENVLITLGAFIFIGACLRAIALGARDNEVTSLMLRRQNLDGVAAAEARKRNKRPRG